MYKCRDCAHFKLFKGAMGKCAVWKPRMWGRYKTVNYYPRSHDACKKFVKAENENGQETDM